MSRIRDLSANTANTNADVILLETRSYRPALRGARIRTGSASSTRTLHELLLVIYLLLILTLRFTFRIAQAATMPYPLT
jgi:hypothetical protein